jgi:GAF domain-containing protein
VRRSIAELELTYYLPCSARGRTIAYLGVSRTEAYDFLSSEDVELLMTLSGYVGIAIDNPKLYERFEGYMRKYGGLTITVLAFLPLPVFDLAGVAAEVVHEPNARSGGAPSRIGIAEFLSDGRNGPEHQALRRVLAESLGFA